MLKLHSESGSGSLFAGPSCRTLTLLLYRYKLVRLYEFVIAVPFIPAVFSIHTRTVARVHKRCALIPAVISIQTRTVARVRERYALKVWQEAPANDGGTSEPPQKPLAGLLFFYKKKARPKRGMLPDVPRPFIMYITQLDTILFEFDNQKS